MVAGKGLSQQNGGTDRPNLELVEWTNQGTGTGRGGEGNFQQDTGHQSREKMLQFLSPPIPSLNISQSARHLFFDRLVYLQRTLKATTICCQHLLADRFLVYTPSVRTIYPLYSCKISLLGTLTAVAFSEKKAPSSTINFKHIQKTPTASRKRTQSVSVRVFWSSFSPPTTANHRSVLFCRKLPSFRHSP